MQAQNNLESAMSRFSSGDDDAFATVYDRLASPLRLFLTRACGDRALAEDLTHETVLKIHRARDLYRPGARVLPWAFTIARRVYADEYRKRRHEKPRFRSDDPANDVVDPRPLADQLLDRKRAANNLDAAISTLPEHQAAVCRLVRDEGLSSAEMAGTLGTSAGTTRVRAHRAYKALRPLLVAERSAVLGH
jgi:RNA polymerase sigma-70 factor, ECF subfamily